MTSGSAGSDADAGWLVAPWFDLPFVVNIGWIFTLTLGLLAQAETSEVAPTLEFWQLYFLTTPHRWLTLAVVALDPDRREGRGAWFLALAGLAAVVIAAVWVCADGFVCLLLIDYVWNGWHFAAQHSGVLRIYARKSPGGNVVFERYGLRVFLCYVIARTAGWTTGWLEDQPNLLRWLTTADLAMLALPALLLAIEFAARPLRQAKLCYLASVTALYATLLIALSLDLKALILALTLAAAIFHATEYLAVVTHYAWRREALGSPGPFQSLARSWTAWLAFFLGGVGMVSAWAQTSQSGGRVPDWWIGLNLWAAFLHYAYDGMIWKLRRPATANVLVDTSPVSSAA